MDLAKIDWELCKLADSNIVSNGPREAAHLAQNALTNIRNALGIDSKAEVSELVQHIYKLLNKEV